MEKHSNHKVDIYKYWGKADKDGNYHLLVYHCLDVAAVGQVWMEKNPGFVKRGAIATGLSEKAFKQWVLFFLALHDIGKFDIRFQGKVPSVLKSLKPSLEYAPHICRGYDHGKQGYLLLQKERHCLDENLDYFLSWFGKVSGHHGIIPGNGNMTYPAFVDEDIIQGDIKSRSVFIKIMKDIFLADIDVDDLTVFPPVSLAGFCSVCDWLGSNINFFDFKSQRTSESEKTLNDLMLYFENRLQNASNALNSAGVVSSVNKDTGMKVLFPKYVPIGVQTVVDKLPVERSLVVIEAPTGSGKTEAALLYASTLTANGSADSIIFALPTQATANAMFDRVEKVANKIFIGKSNLVLAHGKSSFNSVFTSLKERNLNLESSDDCSVQCSQWIGCSKKRSFLGQIGLCTIDQVLLSVLPVKHYFVRLFGLGRSVLIIDEVHAYDSYMYGLLEAVIREQKRMGGSVVLLSATLPFVQKKRLLSAWGTCMESQVDYSDHPYPLVTTCSGGTVDSISLSQSQQPQSFKVDIDLVSADKLQINDALIKTIIAAAEHGAVVAVICNLVADAQKLACKIASLVNGSIPVDIFHSRYRFVDRQLKEDFVIKQYGQNGSRGGRILVATQVVEQSLDIDFDWIVTQLCPVDLLFQRLGRLHRHLNVRPSDYKTRKVTVVMPEVELDYGGTEVIYSNIKALWRTQRLLENNNEICFPQAYRTWIETVYDEDESDIELNETLMQKNNDYIGREYASKGNAAYLVSNRDFVNQLDDLSEKAVSLTREGEMSVSLIPIVETDGVFRLLDGASITSLEENEKWEVYSLNSIPVPNSWRHQLSCFEEGYMSITMKQVDEMNWVADNEGYKYSYSLERGMEREKL